MRQARFKLAASLVLGLATGPAAWAGGLEVADSGGAAMGRGGAFVAKADDPIAIRYNPAGFAKLRGHHLALDLRALHAQVRFARSGQRADGRPHPQISNRRPWSVVPSHLVLSTDLGLFEDLTVAMGAFTPPALLVAYPKTVQVDGRSQEAPQRYDAVHSGGTSYVVVPWVGLAYRVGDWLDVGASFQYVVANVHATAVASAGGACEQAEDPRCDVVARLHVKNRGSPSGSFGALVRPWQWLEIGVAAQLPTTLHLTGQAEIQYGPHLKELEQSMRYPLIDQERPNVAVRQLLPWVGRLGVRMMIARGERERADVELDLIWENWSKTNKRLLKVDAKVLGEPMPAVVTNMRLRDTWALRLGTSYRVEFNDAMALTMRAGCALESETTAVSDTRVQVIGAPRVGPAVGVGFGWGPVQVDVAYTHLFFPRRVVQASSTFALSVDGTEPAEPVGNGTYTAALDLFSLQVTAHFGDAPPAPRAPENAASEARPPTTKDATQPAVQEAALEMAEPESITEPGPPREEDPIVKPPQRIKKRVRKRKGNRGSRLNKRAGARRKRMRTLNRRTRRGI